jgi:hypothetical protein
MASVTHTLRLNAQEVYNKYGIDSKTGYEITSDVKILADEVDKIQRILGAFRELEICEESREVRQRKFKGYVEWQDPEKWEGLGEYSLYKSWQQRLAKATANLNTVKQEFQVKEIKVLNMAQTAK